MSTAPIGFRQTLLTEEEFGQSIRSYRPEEIEFEVEFVDGDGIVQGLRVTGITSERTARVATPHEQAAAVAYEVAYAVARELPPEKLTPRARELYEALSTQQRLLKRRT